MHFAFSSPPPSQPTPIPSVYQHQVEDIEAAVQEGRAGSKGQGKDPRFRRVPKPEQVGCRVYIWC